MKKILSKNLFCVNKKVMGFILIAISFAMFIGESIFSSYFENSEVTLELFETKTGLMFIIQSLKTEISRISLGNMTFSISLILICAGFICFESYKIDKLKKEVEYLKENMSDN